MAFREGDRVRVLAEDSKLQRGSVGTIGFIWPDGDLPIQLEETAEHFNAAELELC